MQRQLINGTTRRWIELLGDIKADGCESKPRGMKTLEILGHQTEIEMRDPIIHVPERALGYRFLAAEAAWILSGDNRVSTIKNYSKHISQFSDDGITFYGAYGPKVIDQISYVINCLAKDNDSRQAVINIWREKPGPTKDVPCTVSLQFLIRDGELYCIDTMRSSDAWLGWPYDIFNMSMISRAIIIGLSQTHGIDVGLGNLILTAGSQHLYDKNIEKAEDILKLDELGAFKMSVEPEYAMNPHRFFTIDSLVETLWEAANSQDPLEIIYGKA